MITTHHNPLHRTRFLLVVLVFCMALFVPESVSAQVPTQASAQCFVVADGHAIDGVESEGKDTLAYLNLDTGQAQSVDGRIPNLENFQIEAIAFKPNSTELYAADGGQLGILDSINVTFTPLPNPVGASARGPLGSVEFNDIDSLSFHPLTGELWGIHRTVDIANASDVLIKIDPETGKFIPGVFEDPNNPGEQMDYLPLEPIGNLDESDDLAIDPTDGTMYSIMNLGGGPSKLVIIDPTDGSTTDLGFFTRQSNNPEIEDVEGLGFASDGQLYASTGNFGKDRNLLWRVDKRTAVSTLVGDFGEHLIDIEALDCLGSSGFVVLESYINGVDAERVEDALVLRAEDPIAWTYLVRNTGSFELLNIQVTDDRGTPNDTSDDLVACQGFDLTPGQTNEDVGVVCQVDGTAQQGQHRNVATLVATDSLGTAYVAEDATYYIAYQGAAVSGRVWHDINGDGLQDSFEANANISGIPVHLYDDTGNAVDNTETDNDGSYIFNELEPGDYYLEFQMPDEYDGFTSQNVGDDDTTDSDVDPDPNSASFGRTESFTLIDGEIYQNWDAGLLGVGPYASVSGYVWEDLNGDAIQNDGDPSEVGIAGVSVSLHEKDDPDSINAVSTTLTDANGSYSFEEVPAGDYFLVFSLPDGYSFTLQNQGDSEALDSDVNPATGRTGIFTLIAGQQATDWDAGMRQEPDQVPDETRDLYLPTVRN